MCSKKLFKLTTNSVSTPKRQYTYTDENIIELLKQFFSWLFTRWRIWILTLQKLLNFIRQNKTPWWRFQSRLSTSQQGTLLNTKEAWARYHLSGSNEKGSNQTDNDSSALVTTHCLLSREVDKKSCRNIYLFGRWRQQFFNLLFLIFCT